MQPTLVLEAGQNKMFTNRDQIAALTGEVVLCFGLPVYLLFWGILAVPFLVGGIPSGNEISMWHIFSVCAGCCGVASLTGFFSYYFAEQSDEPKGIAWILVLGFVGLTGVWAIGSDHFTAFDSVSIFFEVLPTLSCVHLATLLTREHNDRRRETSRC